MGILEGPRRNFKKWLGIIKPLRRGHPRARKKFASGIILNARRRRTPEGKAYVNYGEPPLEISWFPKALDELHRLRSGATAVKVLEIGPGGIKGHIEELAGLGNVEAHTLSPENINPEFRHRVENENYLKNLQHHVGTAQTYNLKGLGGFDLIHARIVLRQSPYPVETTIKISRALKKGGVAFLEHGCRFEGDPDLDLKRIRGGLGPGFEVEAFDSGEKLPYLKIKRLPSKR